MRKTSRLFSTRFAILNRISLYYFSSKHTLTLKDIEEQAITSFVTMQQIGMFEKKEKILRSYSLRQRLAETSEIKKLIMDKAKNDTQFSKTNFSQSNIKKVLEAYHIDKGTIVDFKIWSQDRFRDAQRIYGTGIIVLNPTQITGEMGYYINNYGGRGFSSGEKGTGKSFSFLNYSYLSEFIIRYKLECLSQNTPFSCRFKYFVPQDKLKKIKKIIYIPLENIFSQKAVIRSFLIQVPSHLSQELQSQKVKHNLLKVLDKIKHYYSEQNIDVALIIDEGNIYLRNFRNKKQLNYINIPQQTKTTQQGLKVYSWVLKLFGRVSFELYLINSSQNAQTSLIQKWNIKQNLNDFKYYDFFNHGKRDIGYIALHTKKISQLSGQLEIYHQFWLQFSSSCIRKGNNLYQSPEIKQIFDETFNLPSRKKQNNSQQQYQKLNWWNVDVRHLQIRTVFDKYSFVQMQRALLQPEQKKVQIIKQQFQQLKQKIQKARLNRIAEQFSSYQSKWENEMIKQVRYAIMLTLSESVSNFKLDNKDVSQPRLLEINLKNIYKSLIQDKKNQEIMDIYDEIRLFTQYLGQGFQEQFKCYFFMSPIELDKLNIVKTTDKYRQLELRYSMFFYRVISPQSAGIKMDQFYFRLMNQEKFQLIMKVLRYSQITFIKNREKLNQKLNTQNFPIKKSFQFKSDLKSFLFYSKTLRHIFQQAENNKYKYQWISGYPIMNSLVDKKGLFNQQSPFFDFLLVRKSSDTNQFIIKSFDFTVGAVFNKIKEFRGIQFQILIQDLNFLREQQKWRDVKFVWQHYIFAPKQRLFLLYQQTQLTARQMQFINNEQFLENKQQIKVYHKQMKDIFPSNSQIIPLKVGLMWADYSLERGHFILYSQKSKIQEKVIYSNMKNVLNELEIHYSIEDQKKEKQQYSANKQNIYIDKDDAIRKTKEKYTDKLQTEKIFQIQ